MGQPDDPERARHWQPGINAKIRDDAKRRNIKNPKDEILRLTDNLANMASSGNLKNRNEIISELRGRGYGISRQGKDYITIVDKDGKRTRLKGRLFMEDFNGTEWIKSENAKFSKPDSEKNRIDLELAAKAEAAFLEAVQRAALYNKRRYGVKEEPYDEINLNLETIFNVTSNLEQMEVIHDKPSKQHARNHESNFNTKEG